MSLEINVVQFKFLLATRAAICYGLS